jgi:glycine cleavage system aminomethyltransferase T
VIRDYLPARGTPEQLRRMMRHWMDPEELAAIDWKIEEQFCSPAELGWAHTVDLGKPQFHGREALAREADACPPQKLNLAAHERLS